MSIKLYATDKQREKLQREKDKQANSLMESLAKKKPHQIDNYIDNNVNDIESAKIFLKIITKAVVYLLREKDDE